MSKSRGSRLKEARSRRRRKSEAVATSDAIRGPNFFVRWLDPGVVLLVRCLAGVATLRSRDVTKEPRRAMRPDQREQMRARSWRAVLEWSPEKRVGWFSAVAIGLTLGIAFLWYALSSE